MHVLFIFFRKTLNRLIKETVKQNDGNSAQGKAEVISALRNIQNKDESFAALTRNLSKLSKKGIRVTANNGQIQFNDMSIDMAEFSGTRSHELNAYLSQLPTKTDVTPVEVSSVKNSLSSSLSNVQIPNINEVAMFVAKLLGGYTPDIKEKIISAVAILVDKIAGKIFQQLIEMIPINSMYYKLFKVVMLFFSGIAKDLEDQYQRWKMTKSEEDFNPLFDYVNPENSKRVLELISKSVDFCFELKYMRREAIEKLIKFFYEWFAKKYSDYEDEKKRNTARQTHSALKDFKSKKMDCPICKGYYFQKQS